ncbi:hypothetical protein PTKIN_Ptkin09bG0052600 [Pterospermum kingtungense]
MILLASISSLGTEMMEPLLGLGIGGGRRCIPILYIELTSSPLDRSVSLLSDQLHSQRLSSLFFTMEVWNGWIFKRGGVKVLSFFALERLVGGSSEGFLLRI